MKNSRRNIIVRTDKNDSLNSERKRQKKTECQNKLFCITLFDVYQIKILIRILQDTIIPKFGDLSHVITVRLIWTTRSPHYKGSVSAILDGLPR